MSDGKSDNIRPSDELPQLAVDVRDAARITKASVRTLWREVKAGKLKVKRVGSRVLFPVKFLSEWLETG